MRIQSAKFRTWETLGQIKWFSKINCKKRKRKNKQQMNKYLKGHVSKELNLAQVNIDFSGNDFRHCEWLLGMTSHTVSLESSELPLDWIRCEMALKP